MNDLNNVVAKGEKELRDRAIEMYKNSGDGHPEKYNEEWFNSLPQKEKESIRQMIDTLDQRKMLEQELEKPEVKAKILRNIRKYYPFLNGVEDDDVWEKLSLQDKKKYSKGE